MEIKIRKNSLSTKFLMALDTAEELGAIAFASPYKWREWAMYGKHQEYRTVLYRLMKSGFIKIIDDTGGQVFKLTPEGSLQVLMAKAILKKPEKWDGKWQVIFFDVPEDFKIERQQLRRLLLKFGYKKMQASVYVTPWPINRDALVYLKQTGLIKYIRIGKLEELDDDSDLKKKFNLK